MTKSGKTILIVDDSPSIREIIKYALSSDHSVFAAVDGLDALNYLDGRRVDLVITDLHMPNMDGLELIKAIRLKELYKYIPILFLTTESSVEMKLKAKKEGATGWLQKPFDMEKLKKTVNKLVR